MTLFEDHSVTNMYKPILSGNVIVKAENGIYKFDDLAFTGAPGASYGKFTNL